MSFKTILTPGSWRDRRADRILEISPGHLPSHRNWLLVSLQVPGIVYLKRMLMAQHMVLTHGRGRGTLITVYTEPSCFLNKDNAQVFVIWKHSDVSTPVQGPLK